MVLSMIAARCACRALSVSSAPQQAATAAAGALSRPLRLNTGGPLATASAFSFARPLQLRGLRGWAGIVCASAPEESADAGATAAPEPKAAHDDLRQSLVDLFPRFLMSLQTMGALQMPEAEEAPEKLQDRSTIKKNLLEFARARGDIIYGLPEDLIVPLGDYSEGAEPNKKLRAAVRRVNAQYIIGEPLIPADGGKANFQDVLRIVMEMSFAPPAHLSTVDDEMVKVALELLPLIEELAAEEPSAENIARAAEAHTLRIGEPGSGKGKERPARQRRNAEDRWDAFEGPKEDKWTAGARDGDWECPECGKNNFQSRTKCFGCGVMRSEVDPGFDPRSVRKEMKQGDWECSECGGHNYSRRSSCFSCGIPRVEGDANFDSSKNLAKDGEWMCPECGVNNFYYRTECFRCDSPKPDGIEPIQQSGSGPWLRVGRNERGNQRDMKPGDWECPSCQAHNFARNDACFKCNEERPDGTRRGPSSRDRSGGDRKPSRDMRPGDWECPDCDAHNFARNSSCFRCDAERPEGTRQAFGGQRDFDGRRDFGGQRDFGGRRDRPQAAREMRPGDWECPSCNAHNFSRNDFCFKCDIPRPEGSGGGGQRQESRAGDWDCPECGFSNFGSRRTCKRCDALPSGSASGGGWFEG